MGDAPAWIALAGSLGGVSLGWVGSLLTESRRDARDARRQQAARVAAREDAVLTRRESFELDNLVALHSALRDFGVEIAGQYGDPVAAEKLSEDVRPAGSQVHALSSLVLDEALRIQVRSAMDDGNAIQVSGLVDGPDVAKKLILPFVLTKLPAAMDSVAARIRDLYTAH